MPPLPETPAGVADRWRNIGSWRKTSLHHARQVEKMRRIARSGEKTNDLQGDSCSEPLSQTMVRWTFFWFIRIPRAPTLKKVDMLIPLGVALRGSKRGGQHVHQ